MEKCFAHDEGRTGDMQVVGCRACSLEKGDLHCPSIESVTNTSVSGPMPSSFKKTHHA